MVLVLAPTSVGATSLPLRGTYLALGDSIAFGYVPVQALPTYPSTSWYDDPAHFRSYANDVASALHLQLVNASCPGETSASLIDPRAPSNRCENFMGRGGGYRSFWPLHVHYSGSQLGFAVNYLRSHPQTELVSIDIGANDLRLCQLTTREQCRSAAERARLDTSLRKNLGVIYHSIRVVAGYRGPIVALAYYPLLINGRIAISATEEINSVIDQATLAAGGWIADGFTAFVSASAPYGGDQCAAGLQIRYRVNSSDGRFICNIHPSPLGDRLIARAILTTLSQHGGR
ncbi:MAG: SGNH/GDSL hydrolase family protein [Acidimicrobiales bacterium]